MNQVSQVPFGPDISMASGYFQFGNERLGNFDLIIENTDPNYDLHFQAKAQSAITNSGFANIGSAVTIVPHGVKTLSYNLLGKKFGFFGSGEDSAGNARSVTANVTVVIRNKADLRGAQVDFISAGRSSYGFDKGFYKPSIAKKWGTPPDQPTNTESDEWGGVHPTP